MINLAYKDIKYSFGKFIITAIGVGMLLGIVMIMIGVYRGMIIDAKVLIDDIAADVWVVQKDTLGPFAEASRMHEDLKNTLRVIDGVDQTAALTFQSLQIFNKNNEPVRVFAVGYDPFGRIDPISEARLIQGRGLRQDHYEIVVTDKTGFQLGERLHLGRDIYTVVGITHGTVSSGGDLLVYLSLKDAQQLQFLSANPQIRNDRARGVKSVNSHIVNTVVATVKPGHDPAEVVRHIERWKHLSAYTNEREKEILTDNLIKMASKQIGMFTAILILVSIVIISMIIYNMTVDKIKEISIMKLIGIPNKVIITMIVKETVLLGVLAFLAGNTFAHVIYTRFPKRVVLERDDALMLFLVILLASLLASLIGVHKAVKADPTAAIGG
jgi:putative ABC transport system permease protein